jgi:hypothetical protein
MYDQPLRSVTNIAYKMYHARVFNLNSVPVLPSKSDRLILQSTHPQATEIVTHSQIII